MGRGALHPPAAQAALGAVGLGAERPLSALAATARPARLGAAVGATARGARTPVRALVPGEAAEVSALSLESAALFGLLCELLAARRVLNLGGGFGAVVARTYAARRPGEVVCGFVAPTQAAADRSAAFLRREGLTHGDVSTWEQCRRRPGGPYDLVLHDLGDLTVRARTLRFVLVPSSPPAWSCSTTSTARPTPVTSSASSAGTRQTAIPGSPT